MSVAAPESANPPPAASAKLAAANPSAANPSAAPKRVVVAAGLVRALDGHPAAGPFLLSRRRAHDHLPGMWEFPGGKVEVGESPPDALVRELREELGIHCRVEDVFAVGHHVYPADAHTGGAPKEVFLLVYQAVHLGGTPQAIEVAEFAWMPGEAVVTLPLPPADVPVVDRLRRALAESVYAVTLADEEATRAVGEAFGRQLKAGDVVCAIGDLGAGKTCFAQGVARGLDVPAGHYVNSPTFAIAQVHPGRVPFCHLDLYRVSDADEAEGLGLEELVGTDGVAYVEWPSRIPELIPPDHLVVRLAIAPEGRSLQITAHGPSSAARLGAFIHARSQ